MVLLPKVLSLAVIISLVSGASIYVAQKEIFGNTHISKHNMCLLGLVALLVICASADVYSDYKKNENFSSLVTRKYLRKELENKPELKQFEENLDNPQAMKDVSSLVFNSLRPSERKLVTQIVLEVQKKLRDHGKYGIEDTESLKTTKVLLSDARNKIITILQEHASAHPEFIGDIYSAMAGAYMTYIMTNNSIKQNTN